MSTLANNITSIDWIENFQRWILVPGNNDKPSNRKIKELTRIKASSCYSYDMPKGIIDFIYRAIVKLQLKDTKLIFMKGTVKKNKMQLTHAVRIHELDWGVGTLVIIPRKLRLKDAIRVSIDEMSAELSLMQLVVLKGLLRIAVIKKSSNWYACMAAQILAFGWKELETGKVRKVLQM